MRKIPDDRALFELWRRIRRPALIAAALGCSRQAVHLACRRAVGVVEAARCAARGCSRTASGFLCKTCQKLVVRNGWCEECGKPQRRLRGVGPVCPGRAHGAKERRGS